MRNLQELFRGTGVEPPMVQVEAKTFKGRDRRVEIVGEASYQGELAELAGPKTENGVNVYKTAALVPEPSNRHDKNAVAVKIDGLTVGYLSRDQVPGFHKAIASVGFGSASLVGFRARIHGGWKRPGNDEGHYGVTLLLPESLAVEMGVD